MSEQPSEGTDRASPWLIWFLSSTSYPHLTTLVLNAGMGAFIGIDWAGAFRQLFTDLVGCVSEPNFLMEERGRKSADGQRGAVWGINVLSGYILVSERHIRFLNDGLVIVDRRHCICSTV